MSEFRGSFPSPEGMFKSGRLPSFFEDPERCGYLVQSPSGLAGFVYVRGIHTGPRVMGEFFVVRAARRSGIGRTAAVAAMRRHPGRWEIPFQQKNPGAAAFWRRTATKLVGAAWSEERRPVPDKPEVPPDVWLMFDVS